MVQNQSWAFPARKPSSDGSLLTVDRLLKSPKVLAKRIVQPDTNFITNSLFRTVPTGDSGAVMYSKPSIADIYPARGDVQFVEPTGNFPNVDVSGGEDAVAVAKFVGASFWVTDDAQRRNALNVVSSGVPKVRAALVRQDAARALKAFRDEVETVNSVATTDGWAEAKAMRRDLLTNAAAIKSRQLGYRPDTIMVHPETLTTLQLLDEIQNFSPRENTALNPLFRNSLAGLLGFNWVENEFMSRDEAILFQQNITGFVAEEIPFMVETERVVKERRTYVYASRSAVPVIDEPGSAVIISGVNGGVV